jgi:hypothetical protein
MNATYWTRTDYLNANHGDRAEGMRAHRRFWSQFVDERTIAYVVDSIGADVLASSELARLGPDAGDVHLNDINEHGYQGSLPNWDRAGRGCPKACKPSDVGLHGFSDSDLVCIAKEAARQHIET